MLPYLADNDQSSPEPLFHCEDNPPISPYNDEPVIIQYSQVKREHIAPHTVEGNYSVLKREERDVS